MKSSLVFTDPQTTHHIESVVRQKHPAEFSDEFDCMADVVYIFIVEKVAKVQAWVAHLQDFDAFVKTTKVDVSKFTVYAKKFKTKHASARAAWACLDSEQVAEKLRHKVWV